jgi:hypothetical protein
VQTPIDEMDAAARILDPVFAPLAAAQGCSPAAVYETPSDRGICQPVYGTFMKDYFAGEASDSIGAVNLRVTVVPLDPRAFLYAVVMRCAQSELRNKCALKLRTRTTSYLSTVLLPVVVVVGRALAAAALRLH